MLLLVISLYASGLYSSVIFLQTTFSIESELIAVNIIGALSFVRIIFWLLSLGRNTDNEIVLSFGLAVFVIPKLLLLLASNVLIVNLYSIPFKRFETIYVFSSDELPRISVCR